MDLLAWKDFNENDANNFTASGKRTFNATAASQLNCFAGNNLENVQECGRESFVDVSVKCKYITSYLCSFITFKYSAQSMMVKLCDKRFQRD